MKRNIIRGMWAEREKEIGWGEGRNRETCDRTLKLGSERECHIKVAQSGTPCRWHYCQMVTAVAVSSIVLFNPFSYHEAKPRFCELVSRPGILT